MNLVPRELTRQEIIDFLPTIEDSSLECVEIGGMNWWTTDCDDQGSDLMIKLAELIRTPGKVDKGSEEGTLRLRSSNIPIQFWYAALEGAAGLVPKEPKVMCSVSWNPVQNRKSALFVATSPDWAYASDEGLVLLDNFGEG